ncbi:hypothetical protein LDG_8553 [Legionella drancourtii LLAP12]|uniref:Uncharacterized protein n=1 Tax=Legionella drancourtii LLAP12 TaxID=658187 RepID=G9ETC2_9GAMM|nr:hypothetical protein LDG_8553 [Legionella drancourtii LLAP12]
MNRRIKDKNIIYAQFEQITADMSNNFTKAKIVRYEITGVYWGA